MVNIQTTDSKEMLKMQSLHSVAKEFRSESMLCSAGKELKAEVLKYYFAPSKTIQI